MVTKKSLYFVFLLNTFFLLNQFVTSVDGGGGGGGERSGSVDEDDYIEDFSVNAHDKSDHAIPNKILNNVTHVLNKNEEIIKPKATISLEFFDDPLRQGLQPFYVISNYIIDEVIKPNIPKCKILNIGINFTRILFKNLQ